MNLRCVHLLSQPDTERERRSVMEVSQLARYGVEYRKVVNAPYDGEVPPAREANDRPFALTPAHYGCYKAHRDAIDQYLTDDIDGLLIVECDTVFALPIHETFERIKRAYEAMLEHDLLAFTFGYKHNSKTLERHGDIILISQWIESHCYLITPKSKPVFMDMLSKPFDAYDYCLTIYLLDIGKQRIGTFADRPIAIQGFGLSIIDKRMKTSEDHFRAVRYDP